MSDSTRVAVSGSFTPIDDAQAARGKNGLPASADHMRTCIDALNGINASGRNVFNWWDGDGTTNQAGLLRQMWNRKHLGSTDLAGRVLILPATGLTPQTGQGIRTTHDYADVCPAVNSETTDFTVGSDANGAAWTADNPEDLKVHSFLDPDDATLSSVQPHTLTIGSMTSNGPGLVAGAAFTPARHAVTIGGLNYREPYTPIDFVHPNGDIVAASGSTISDLARLRASFLHAWAYKRPQLGWSMINPGTNYVNFNVSSQAFRYIFNQNIGDGGTAPTYNGPGITLPLYKCASGRNTAVRLSVWVYAAMSGATDTGTIGIAHRNTSGGMTSIAGATSGAVAITGTSFQWWHTLCSGTMYFSGTASIGFDRIVLCAKSSGATDTVRVGAFTIFVEPTLSTGLFGV